MKKGSAVSIKIDDNYSFLFQREHLVTLLTLFLELKLSETQINYLVDCLLLSEKVEFGNGKLFDILESLTDPSVNGHLTHSVVQTYLKNI